MPTQFQRTQLLLGRDAMERLARCRVAVFGLGGVGGSAAEALARSGIGAIDLYDDDKVCLTNINRQAVAAHSTIGKHKADAMAERLLDINPGARIEAHRLFYLPETADQVDFSALDYVIDAVDTVRAKLDLAERCSRLGVPLISAMGAGNKLDPTRLRVADVYETDMCPLARVMRKELKKRGIPRLKVVFSDEPPVPLQDDALAACRDHCVCPPGTARTCAARRAIPGSVAFVPPVMGLILAGEVIKDLARGRAK